MSGAVFRVVVDGKRTSQLWRQYTGRDEAQAACSHLRALGLDARIVGPGDDDEPKAEIDHRFGMGAR